MWAILRAVSVLLSLIWVELWAWGGRTLKLLRARLTLYRMKAHRAKLLERLAVSKDGQTKLRLEGRVCAIDTTIKECVILLATHKLVKEYQQDRNREIRAYRRDVAERLRVYRETSKLP